MLDNGRRRFNGRQKGLGRPARAFLRRGKGPREDAGTMEDLRTMTGTENERQIFRKRGRGRALRETIGAWKED